MTVRHWVLQRHPGMHFFIVARITVWGETPAHHLLVNETLLFDHGLNRQIERLRSSFDVVHADQIPMAQYGLLAPEAGGKRLLEIMITGT